MITKLWQLKSMFALIGLFVAFAACVKEKDPIEQRNEIKDVAGAVTVAVNSGSLSELNKQFVQPVPEGNGPNRLMSLLGERSDSVFVMFNRKFTFDPDGGTATVAFTFTEHPEDTVYSFIHFVDDGGWKIKSFEIN